MNKKIKSLTRKTINRSLSAIGFELVRCSRTYDEYLPLKETLAAARDAGLSVGDYIEAVYNVPGTTHDTIQRIEEMGVFNRKIDNVCEIGPGSGRYLEKTQQACNPGYYEIYETAIDWGEWLVQQYGVIAKPTDGFSLKSTQSGSIDLVQSHKVFPICNLRTTFTYFIEMVRVLRDHGTVVFDIVTEECLDCATFETWYDSGFDYPVHMLPKQYVIDFFLKRNLSYVGSFVVPMGPLRTECFVLLKD